MSLSRRLSDSDSAPKRSALRAGSAGGRDTRPRGRTRTAPRDAPGLQVVKSQVHGGVFNTVSLKNCNRNLMKEDLTCIFGNSKLF